MSALKAIILDDVVEKGGADGVRECLMVRKCVSEEVAFELTVGKRERTSCSDIWRNSIPGRGHSLCKGPGAGLCLVHWRNTEEACVAGAE